jgi:hypothetical protein
MQPSASAPHLLVLSILSFAIGCATGSPMGASTSCEPKGPARPICGFQNPEDLVALPGNEAILVSEYGSMAGDHSGDLAIFVLESEERRVLFRGGDAAGSQPTWGDPSCPGPPSVAFSPHGIHLSTRPDDSLQLLVVQHGGRESVEFFEVTGSGTEFEVAWRGCVEAPEDAWLNSVAAISGGGFVASNMMSRSAAQDRATSSFLTDEPTGHALEWLPGEGFRILAGTTGVLPNGVEVSRDGRKVFLNLSGESEVRRVDRSTGEIEARAAVPLPDNARWAPDGRLLIASLMPKPTDDFSSCENLEAGFCPLAFQIVALDPDSMQTEVLYANEGPPMGGGTIGLQIGHELFIGSFGGDRILRVALGNTND